MRSITVVLTTFSERRWPQLQRAVRSLHGQTQVPDEIVIVVDHNPALLCTVRDTFPAITAIQNREPAGLSGARNTGLAAAAGEIVAFIDDDAEASPDWLERLRAAYADATVIGSEGSVDPVWDGGNPAWLPAEFLWVVGCSYRGLPDRRSDVRNLIGCNMSFRRRALLAAGGFRTGIGRVGSIPLGCEETELCIRLTQRTRGARIVYDPAARVRHHVSADRARWAHFRRRCWAEGRSKALVAASVGSERALASERAYVGRTLPRGMADGLRRALGGDPAGLLSAAAIVAGAALTTLGYLSRRVRAGAVRPLLEMAR